MRGLCHHYGVELHNFSPNAISQAACFIAVCEGFLGVPANWDPWVHLFPGELPTLATGKKGMHRAVRTDVLTLALRDTRKDLYLPCTMTSNNADWEKGWFYLRNDGAGLPPYTGKVLTGKPDAWFHCVLPPSQQRRLESLTNTLRLLADSGLGAASVIANFHHRRIIPFMERELRIYEERRDQSCVVGTLAAAAGALPQGYAATRARHTTNLKVVPHNVVNLGSFVMLPDARSVSTVLPLHFCFFFRLFRAS
jgi:hypothetical protein